MQPWYSDLSDNMATKQALAALVTKHLPEAAPLFRPADRAAAFVVVLKGRIEVRLTGPTGREILLYAVAPGQSCIQTTLGLLGDELYTGEAVTTEKTEVVLIPKPLFLRLMDQDPGFRGFVLRAFGKRMSELTHVLEQVAFGRIETRLAGLLLELAKDGEVHATQAELAAQIGSAREVITRKLDHFAKDGWIETERGRVKILKPAALRLLSSDL